MSEKVPPPPEGSDSNPAWARDKRSEKEVKNWADEDALRGVERRNQKWVLLVLGFIVPIFMILFALIFGFAIAIWAIHYFIPESCHWLSPDQLAKIQSVIFSGSLGAIVSAYAQNRIMQK